MNKTGEITIDELTQSEMHRLRGYVLRLESAMKHVYEVAATKEIQIVLDCMKQDIMICKEYLELN